ncbi:alkene reductase [Streptomyces chartreusis]|uniref:alkene reductase n=1 Tax=Streptomyces chartreusis TaxID=1969 RepID=UPI003D93C270
MAHDALFTPLKVGPYELAHRVVMGPLTRMRAAADTNAATELNRQYYEQRASAGGLIIGEASQVDATGRGFPDTPGIHTDEQVTRWRMITDTVHARSGVMFAQLWHTGRVSTSRYQPGGAPAPAPSAIAAAGEAMTPDFRAIPNEVPRALSTGEIREVVGMYRRGAEAALAAGFDGVELHAGFGYLPAQFLNARSNCREDAYGGTPQNRARFVLEIVAELVDVWGADRVAIRMSPFADANDSYDPDPEPTYRFLTEQLAPVGLAYLHAIEPRPGEPGDRGISTSDFFRAWWPGVIIATSGFTPGSGASFVTAGRADAISYGRLFIANPDLPERIRQAAPLNPYDRGTFYGGGEAGYTDYPTLSATAGWSGHAPRTQL